jgi:hypothetical protein
MHGGAEPGIIEEWMRMASAEPNARRRSEYGALAVIFAEAAGIRALWKDALKDWNMVESQQVLEWQEEARVDTQVVTIVAILEDKFQAVPADLTKALRAIADSKRLHRLALLAAKAPSLDQFRADAGL